MMLRVLGCEVVTKHAGWMVYKAHRCWFSTSFRRFATCFFGNTFASITCLGVFFSSWTYSRV